MIADPRYYLVTDQGWVRAAGMSLAEAGHEIARMMDEADGSREPLPNDSVAEQLAIDWDDGEIAGSPVYLLSGPDLLRVLADIEDEYEGQPSGSPLDPCL